MTIATKGSGASLRSSQFTWHLSDLRISHKHTTPGCPEVNGKVEGSHKTDSEEFYQGRHFKHERDLARKLNNLETKYKEDRWHLTLKGKTPAERVHELIQASEPVRALLTNTYAVLERLEKAARGSDNLMAQILQAVEPYATAGEISGDFRKVRGEFREALTV